MLAGKTNESDAILAKHVFVLSFVPRFVGTTRCEGGPLSKQARPFFRRVQGRLFVPLKRRSRQSTGEIETRQGWNWRAKLPSAELP
jgi:hypothetical protein